jgi:hypothetical protein
MYNSMCHGHLSSVTWKPDSLSYDYDLITQI